MDYTEEPKDLPNLRTVLNPSTSRGDRTVIHTDSQQKYLAYGNGINVVFRNLSTIQDQFAKVRILSKHLHPVTAVSVAPSGGLIASGDEGGTVVITWENNFMNKNVYEMVIPGRINGIEWSPDSKRILVYGDGKKDMAKVIMFDTGNTLGDVACHVGGVLSGDFKPSRPFRVFTGGKDMKVNFFEGPPFKLKAIKEYHDNFVNAIKFCPDGSKVASVGSDRRIVMYDGKTGDHLETVAERDTEGNHTGAILAIEWLDNESYVTASLDSTLKVWKDKTNITLNIAEKPEIEHKLAGLNVCTDFIIALSLNGDLHFWSRDKLKDQAFPCFSQVNHQNNIDKLFYSSISDEVLSFDIIGKVCFCLKSGVE